MAKKKNGNSKVDALRRFVAKPPADWDKLTSAQRKAAAVKATGMSAAYLQVFLGKADAKTKSHFAIKSRAKRKGANNKAAAVVSRIHLPNVLSALEHLTLDDLISVSKVLRKRLAAKLKNAQAEIQSYK